MYKFDQGELFLSLTILCKGIFTESPLLLPAWEKWSTEMNGDRSLWFLYIYNSLFQVSHVFGREGDYILWPSNPYLWKSEAFSNLTPREIKGKELSGKKCQLLQRNESVCSRLCMHFFLTDVNRVRVQKRENYGELLPDLLQQLFP